MDSMRVSEALDPGSIPGKATQLCLILPCTGNAGIAPARRLPFIMSGVDLVTDI